MSTPLSDLHQAALDYALQGIPVFPCQADGKAPACAHGHKDATTDFDQINTWWAGDANYNPAFSPESTGQCVIDLDPGHEPIELPETREIRTPRGGSHLYFQGSLPPSAGKLGKKIDTRGKHSYVLLPPSVVNGKAYEVLYDRPVAPLPPGIAACFTETNKQDTAVVTGLDAHANIDRARRVLVDCVSRGDIAIQQQGGDYRTYRLAAEIQALGISEVRCLSLLEEIWNPHCLPPWPHAELQKKVANALAYMQNAVGSNAVGTAAETFGDALESAPTPEPRSRFYFEDDAEQDLAPDPEWLIPGLIPDRATVLVLGLTGSFKSFLVQDILLAIAAQVPTFSEIPKRFGPTFYGAHEVRDDIRKARKQAWKIAKEKTTDFIPFYVARGPHVASSEECNEFREQIRVRLRQSSQKIGAIALDTVAKCMVGLNENDASDVGKFINFIDNLRDEFECSVICSHHFGKDEGRGGRGSSAFQAGFDTTLAVKRIPQTKFVSVKVVQHASAPEREEPFYFEGVPVGRSLVFQPISSTDFRAAQGHDDTYDRRKVGAALKALGAIGPEQGVTTHVLWSSLVAPDEIETPEQRQEAADRGVRALSALARTKLEAYVAHKGRALLWHLS